ncbi:MAG: PAS domain S-box protein [Verrucomicrobiales bacterium]|nr:PAS domain S-box protein [Verrucomicrobiales bacterium]
MVNEPTGLNQALARESALEARYRDLFENAKDTVYTHDMAGNFTSVNHAFELLTGYSREEAVQMSIFRLALPRYAEPLKWMLAARTPLPANYELRIETKAGRVVDIQVSARMLLENGRHTGVQGIARDITEKKRAEEAVRLTEELYRRAIAAADAVPYQRNYATETFSFMGEGILGMTGYSAAEMTPALWDSLVEEVRMQGEASGLSLEEAIARTRAGKIQRWMNDCRIVTRSGSIRWISDRSIQALDENGVPIGAIGTLQDVTDRKRTEEELQRSEARFRRVVESNLIGIAFWNADGTVTDANERFLQMLGYTREELLKSGAQWGALLIQNPREAGPSCHEAPLGYCKPSQKEFLRRDGSRLPVLLGAAYLDRERQCGVSFVLDISEQLKLEGQFRQAQKMESVGRLAGGVAHDFNNILTVIHGHCSMLTMSPHLPSEDQESAREIIAAADRAANLTRQLLTFSRKQIVQPRQVDLNEVISQLTKMLTRLLGEDVALQCNYSAHLPAVYADPGMMEQVMMNLAVNARDAMPQGGQLMINTSVASFSEGRLPHPRAHAGRFVCITVADTGCGMASETLTHIFEPFFTTKEVGKGTGLGLATVYGIVELHHGWIEVASQVGCGTSFRIFFPVLADEIVAGTSPTLPEPLFRGNETILLAEDEPALRKLVRQTLSRCGYEVIEAASGREALERCNNSSIKIDLLLTDLVMPGGISGTELAAQLRSRYPTLKVIYSSGYSIELVAKDCELVDGLNFLPKPYDPKRLARAVRTCLDSELCATNPPASA